MNELIVQTLPMANRVIRSIGIKPMESIFQKAESGWIWGHEIGREGLEIVLESGWGLVFADVAWQSCCESRYMHTDDNLETLVGETLREIYVGEGGTQQEEEWRDCKEFQFLHICTFTDAVVVGAYNEHNGYYSGLDLAVTIFSPQGEAVVYQKSFTGE